MCALRLLPLCEGPKGAKGREQGYSGTYIVEVLSLHRPHRAVGSPQGLGGASLDGRGFSTSLGQIDGDEQSAVALHLLQAASEAECFSLHDLQCSVADCYGSHLHPWSEAAAQRPWTANDLHAAVGTVSGISAVLTTGAIILEDEVTKTEAESEPEKAIATQQRQRRQRSRTGLFSSVPAVSASAQLSCPRTTISSAFATAEHASTMDAICGQHAHGTSDEHKAYDIDANASHAKHRTAICNDAHAGTYLAAEWSNRSSDRPACLSPKAISRPALGCPGKSSEGIREARQKVINDFQVAAKSMGYAKAAYEEALLARSQHISTRKTFLAEDVKNWKDYGRLFEQHEQALKERTSVAKEHFMEAKSIQDIGWPCCSGGDQPRNSLQCRSRRASNLSPTPSSNSPKRQKQSK